MSWARPSVYPAGDSEADKYAEPLQAPIQKCALPKEPLKYEWDREVECYAMVPGAMPPAPREPVDWNDRTRFIKLTGEACAQQPNLPAFRKDTGAPYMYQSVVPQAKAQYTTEYCPLGWDVGPWSARQPFQ
jgi:hypothetical protein